VTDVGSNAPGALRPGSPEAKEQVRQHRARVRAQEDARQAERDTVPDALARIEFACQRIDALLQKETAPEGRFPFRLFRRR
jgi:hypothetical protein